MNPTFQLIDFESPQGHDQIATVARDYGPDLARFSGRVTPCFLVGSAWAPGLHVIGGIVDSDVHGERPGDQKTFSATGSGTTASAALASCLGEGIERLSQCERDGDIVRIGDWRRLSGDLCPGMPDLLEACARALPDSTPGKIGFVRGRTLTGDRCVLVPADWCIRRAKSTGILKPRTALSTGTAAGPDFETAATSAILELVERHAAHLWWIAGRRPAMVPLESTEAQAAAALLAALRGDRDDRATCLLDLTTEIGVPSLAAVSFDRDGKGLACGLAARLNPAAAAEAAVRELCQMETGLLLARARWLDADTEEAKDRMNPADRAHLERALALAADTCPLLQPVGVSPARCIPLGAEDLKTLKYLLEAHSVDVTLVDLTRAEFGVNVVHAVAPAMLPLPSYLPSPSSAAACAQHGGAARWTGDVPIC